MGKLGQGGLWDGSPGCVEERGLGRRGSQVGSAQAVFVFQSTAAHPRLFQLTVDKLEQALLEATLTVRRAPCLRVGAAAPERGHRSHQGVVCSFFGRGSVPGSCPPRSPEPCLWGSPQSSSLLPPLWAVKSCMFLILPKLLRSQLKALGRCLKLGVLT